MHPLKCSRNADIIRIEWQMWWRLWSLLTVHVSKVELICSNQYRVLKEYLFLLVGVTTVPAWWEGGMCCCLLAHWHKDSCYTHGLRSPRPEQKPLKKSVLLSHKLLQALMMSWCYHPSDVNFSNPASLRRGGDTYMQHDMMSVTEACCWLRCKGGGVPTWMCLVNSVARGWLESSTADHGLLSDRGR